MIYRTVAELREFINTETAIALRQKRPAPGPTEILYYALKSVSVANIVMNFNSNEFIDFAEKVSNLFLLERAANRIGGDLDSCRYCLP